MEALSSTATNLIRFEESAVVDLSLLSKGTNDGTNDGTQNVGEDLSKCACLITHPVPKAGPPPLQQFVRYFLFRESKWSKLESV